jgi:hypothetical protein
MAVRQNTSARRIEAAEKRAKAVEMRLMGMPYRKIASRLGISVGMAHKAVTKAMADLQAQQEEAAEQVRAMELDRLDQIMFQHFTQALKGDTAATDRVLKIMERRAKLLGLDAPSKIAPTSPDGEAPYQGMTEQELDQRIAELQAKLGEDA